MTTDLSQGRPGGVLLRFSLPMLISVAFQQLYNIADTVIAGKCIGEDALSAIGGSYPITMIFMAVAFGCNIGCSVVVSQLFGARQMDRVKTAVTTTLLSSLVLCVLLTTGGLLLSRQMLTWIDTPQNTFGDAAVYLDIYIMGLTFLFFYNVCTGIFTAMGDSKTPLYLLIASSLGNIVLDLLFVAVFRWGVAGTAWATFMAQGVSCILAMILLLLRMRSLYSPPYPLFSWHMLGKIALISLPSVLQQSFISVGNLFVQALVNGFGSAVVAGYTAAIKLNTFTITCLANMGNALSGYTAQNLGAGKPERVGPGFRASLLIALLVVIPFIAFYTGGGRLAMTLFLKKGESAAAFDTGIHFLTIVSPFYPFVMVKLVADGLLRGSGRMRFFMISTFTDLILRVALAYVLSVPMGMGTTGIWLSWPVGWVVGAGIAYLFYRTGCWKPKPQKA